jgi:aldehyde dehydrogenase (NAD+)
VTAVADALERLGVPAGAGGVAIGSAFTKGAGPRLRVTSPIDGAVLREIGSASVDVTRLTVATAARAFDAWRAVPAPRRREVVRLLAEL